MPFYEYECSGCGHYVEVLQKISDPPLKKCPKCGKPKLAKLVSAPVFRLKGAGWYETDFKSDGETKRNLVESAEPKAESTTESKEAPKPAEAKAETPAPKKESAAKFAPAKKTVAKSSKPKKAAKSKPVRKKAARR